MKDVPEFRAKLRARALGFAIVVAVCVIWEAIGSESTSFRLLFSSPSRIYTFAFSEAGNLVQAFGVTLAEAALGLVLSTVIALVCALCCFLFPEVLPLIRPALVAVQVIPLVVFAPFLVIALGYGFWSKVAMASIMAFFPTFVSALSARNSLSRAFDEFLDIYNASRADRVFRVYLILALPGIFSGLRVAATLSVVGAIVAEFTGATIGLGKNIFLTSVRLDPELLWTSVAGSCVIGWLLYGVVRILERLLVGWHFESTSGQESDF